MATYNPPTENYAIFDRNAFLNNVDSATVNNLSSYFLRFPTAQGNETLKAITVQNGAEFQDNVDISGTGKHLQFPDNTQQTTAFTDLSPAPTGSYTYSSITVNSKGQVTAASSGTAPTANTNVYDYPQIWRCSTLYAAGSSVPLPGGLKTAVINIPLPATGGLTNTPQAMALTLEIHYMIMQQTTYGAIASNIMGQWFSTVTVNVSPLQKAINGTDVITFVKIQDYTSTGTSGWSSQSINYSSQPPVGGSYSTGTFTPLSYTYTNGASPHPTLTITFGGITSPYLSASSAGGASNYQPLLGLQRTVRIIDTPVENTFVNSNTQTFPNTNTATQQAYFTPVSSS